MLTAKIMRGHALDVLRTLPDGSVHCVVTSPPYWGLRDYKLEPQVWGGIPSCPHSWGQEAPQEETRPRERPELWKAPAGLAQRALTVAPGGGSFCSLCSAWRGSLGLEPTPALYVQHIVAVFREVRRTLRSDGTVWLNVGDSYAAAGYSNHQNTGGAQREDGGRQRHLLGSGLKPKDLVGIPWRVALALQADGWWLRSDIIWCLGRAGGMA